MGDAMRWGLMAGFFVGNYSFTIFLRGHRAEHGWQDGWVEKEDN